MPKPRFLTHKGNNEGLFAVVSQNGQNFETPGAVFMPKANPLTNVKGGAWVRCPTCNVVKFLEERTEENFPLGHVINREDVTLQPGFSCLCGFKGWLVDGRWKPSV